MKARLYFLKEYNLDIWNETASSYMYIEKYHKEFIKEREEAQKKANDKIESERKKSELKRKLKSK